MCGCVVKFVSVTVCNYQRCRFQRHTRASLKLMSQWKSRFLSFLELLFYLLYFFFTPLWGLFLFEVSILIQSFKRAFTQSCLLSFWMLDKSKQSIVHTQYFLQKVNLIINHYWCILYYRPFVSNKCFVYFHVTIDWFFLFYYKSIWLQCYHN